MGDIHHFFSKFRQFCILNRKTCCLGVPSMTYQQVFNLIGLLPFEDRFLEHPKGHPLGGTLYGEVSYAF